MHGRHLLVLAVSAVAFLSACGGQNAPEASASQSIASSDVATLGSGDVVLDAGTYRVDASPYPPFEITVPGGWRALDGWAVYRTEPDGRPAVGVQFWNVDQVYADSCRWQGTEVRPGPTVDDLVAALVEVPMRGTSQPTPITLDGYNGVYLEWTVPKTIEFDGEGNAAECDGDGEGHFDFRSWTGKPPWASVRYHQGSGQVDRVWVLDVDGSRLVIDAFSMPWASNADLDSLADVVESLDFQE